MALSPIDFFLLALTEKMNLGLPFYLYDISKFLRYSMLSFSILALILGISELFFEFLKFPFFVVTITLSLFGLYVSDIDDVLIKAIRRIQPKVSILDYPESKFDQFKKDRRREKMLPIIRKVAFGVAIAGFILTFLALIFLFDQEASSKLFFVGIVLALTDLYLFFADDRLLRGFENYLQKKKNFSEENIKELKQFVHNNIEDFNEKFGYWNRNL